MNLTSSSDHIHVQIDGSVSGQVAIGNNILQIGEIHGGIVNILPPDKKPTFTHKPRPMYIRPHAFPGLLNRKEELGTAVGALRVSEPVSIHGENGLGKTALLRYLAYNSPGDNFPDGIVYFPARGKTADDLLQEIFDSFYEGDCPAKPSVAQLHQLLQSVCALILLDDIALDYEQVSELINCAPQCVFVFASTERCLWGEGRCVQLAGLPTQEALTLIERELGHRLEGEQRSIAEAFCEKIKGHPLYVIQGAAWVRQGKTFAEIGDKFTESEDTFVKTILAELTDSQKRVLLLLAASGNFPISLNHLEAISQVQGFDAQLKPLLDLHLIQANSPAYNLTGSLALSLGRITDLSDWEDRVREYFIQWIRQNPPLPNIQEVLNLLLSVLEKANRAGRWQDVISLGRGMEKALILGKRWQAWLQVLEWVLKAAQILGDRAVQGWALHQLGTRNLCLGNLEPARQSLTQALSIREALGDQAGAAVTRHNLSLILAPPAPPREIPHSKPGPAPKAGGPSVLKAMLGFLGISVVVVLGVLLWKLLQPLPPPTPSVAPPIATPTKTLTPTPTSSQIPTATYTRTITATRTPTRTLTPSRTPTLTPSRTPTVEPTGSVSIEQVSTNLVYAGDTNCGPTDVIITTRVIAPKGIKAVDLFYRFDTGGPPSEFQILSMKPIGGDLYQRVLNPTSLLGGSVPFDQATLKYQVVIEQTGGDASLRTPVMSDIGVKACHNITATNTPDRTPPPAPSIVEPSNNQVLGCPRPTVSGDEVFLRWTEPSDPSGISNYVIELRFSLDAITWNGLQITKGRVTQFEISDFIATQFDQCNSEGRIYFKWRIQAWDSAYNVGAWSTWAEFNVLNVN